MTEQELLDALAQADVAYEEAKAKMAKAKRAWVDTETEVIEAKLARDRIREQLGVFRRVSTTVIRPNSRTQEIEDFRERNPEIVEFARERDKIEED